MKLLLLYCSIFSLFLFTNGGNRQQHQDHYETEEETEQLESADDYEEQYESKKDGPVYPVKVSQKSNQELLQCMIKLFDQLFAVHQEQDSEEDKDAVMTENLYQNSQCVIKSIKSSEKLVRLFGLFLEKIMKLKAPEMETKTEKEIKKAKQDVYVMAVEIVNALRTDQKMLSKLSRTVTSFLESMRPPKPTDADDQVSQLLSQNLLSCLAYHFNATFQFNYPKEIKQQDKILDMFLRWNSGCITVTANTSKRVLYYLAKIFKDLFNLKPSGSSTKEQKDFYGNINTIADELAYKFGENATVTGYRMILSLIDRIIVPEINEPGIKITRANFDGVPVIIHEPVKRSSKLRPGLMFYHGGGWVYRSAEKYLPQTVYLAKHLDAVVISVEYRQSPEFKYPIPVDDCLTATKYFIKNAKKLFKVDRTRIGVAGDSAGGNMAASVSLMMRDRKLRKPKAQVLIYPCIQMFDFNVPSYQQNEKSFGLFKDEMVDFYLTYTGLNSSYKDDLSKNKHICEDMKNSIYGSYLDINVIPDEYKHDYVINETDCDPILAEAVQEIMLSPYIFPLMAKDLRNLSPALIINGEFDILRDEGLMYGSRLRKAGVPLEEQTVKGGYHGTIDMLGFLDIGKQVMDIIVKYLKENL